MTAGPITREERALRARHAFDHLPQPLDALVLFDDQYILYYAGFAFFPTERPVALVITREGERTLFVPRLEREHAQQTGEAEQVVDYPEFPGRPHPMQQLGDLLDRLGVASAAIGVDHDGYPSVMGYDGPALSTQLGGAQIVRVSRALDHQMALKSPAELALIRESARWGAYAHRLLQDATHAGANEHEVEAKATREATAAMTAALGPSYRGQNRWISGATALYRGQIGPNSALPHAMTTGATFQTGDVLVTGAGAAVWGYISELERTMFVGKVSAEQQRYFQHMLNLQDIAFEALKPGKTCASVDEAVRAYFEEHQLNAHWRHHVGHSLGQRIHESPFLDIGDERVLEPGMVLSVEPGLYVPGLGGFRHSDTILITQTGMELLTDYPRDLESLTLPA
ncbi:Xaa-Pro peptidase family protein (plasmid) [Deinococcus sp. KNUC1210]|uniref:M24 family metallopeptidase n=1 Tax=Deinococcus sp. KNUC1210 TaxID=2917691 RepID=UPI001EF0C73F|nr:Xaa-Pro peptidase family protein [Deinococcus sp. KNUC1210]ULH13887.1 Xaa-Pro peptidase family protein [Deinococcus sp. KNUC1210]